ncbi:DUF4329 domain-containing protein [Escherichia coli]|uniref:DUF4329 domain-containing protein n=1 Tax=Escherichia coli TaxID=562 RepID=UPI00192A0E38|nr:DUF4329 domain-containing protein [Escherichia coli]MBL3996030.1 RHS repeat protein [Escherichia coli]
MSGKPAARQGDMTQYGGPIVQGSAGVRIGAPTGVACSVCPGGMTSGNPVNPLLGAKVLPGETDLALPGPLPFILSRTYSSYRTKTPAPVGVFGPGWKAPSDIRLQLRDDGLILNDNGGRSIHFEPLLPGEAVYSRSESMWLVRGGKAAQPDGHTLARLWGALPPDIRLSPHLYLATNSAQGPWWILGWSERVPGAEDVLPAPLPPYRVLTGMADRFGRTLTYRREAAGDLAGEITGVTDGAGREFRLVLTTQAQRAEEARTSSLSSSDSSRPLSASAFPDTLPGTEYGPDRGIRLSAVWLMHDPAYPESLPAAIQTVYEPGSFTPLIRVETENGEREKAQRRSLAETLQQEGSENGHGVVFPAELVRLLDRLEEEIRADRVSSESRAWLAQCGLTVEQLARQVEPEYTPARKAHLYHCDHRGLPLALISEDGNTAWSAEYDEWGNQLNEENPHHVYQPYRLPGQQHDEESGLYYNRHRYYDPLQGRYITQDPMGLKGGWNLYQYPLNPLQQIDPMGLLQTWDDARSGACTGGVCGVLSRIIGPSKFDSTADAALDALKETQNRSLCNDMEYSGIVCKDTNGKYFASKAETDNLRKESYPLKRKCPTGTDRVAAYHTHGADSHGDYVDEFFSSSDKNLVRSKDNNLKAFYLATPDGRFEALNNKGEYIFIRNSVPGLSSVCIPYHD